MRVRLLDSIAQVRNALLAARTAGSRIGLVPTMGALHAGHARLIERAREQCGVVVVSVFVNPLQFDRPDDLERYPRTLDADMALCDRAGVDVVFAPSAREMYPGPPSCVVDVQRIGDHLCGRYRPGHFRGVATVVMKLFQIVQPDRAYFGEKDAQQLAVIRHLVRDLNVPLSVEPVATVREDDGLAMSSRNRLLKPDERALAPTLYQALLEARDRVAAGEREVEAVKATAASVIPLDGRVRLEYLEVVDPDTMQPLERIDGPSLIAGAMWVGSTRIIDNVLV